MTLAMCGQNVGCLKSNSSVSLFGNLFVAVILPFIFGNPRICPQTARGWGGGGGGSRSSTTTNNIVEQFQGWLLNELLIMLAYLEPLVESFTLRRLLFLL